MTNKWFLETFLPSIFNTVGANKQKWLTARQTMICVDNMAKHTVRYNGDGYGTMYSHDNYTCEWDGRQVFLQYSKKNGCGCIEFGYNVEEKAVLNARAEGERTRIKRERIERIKRNPERLAKTIEKLKKEIEGLIEEYEEDIADGEEKWAKEDLNRIAELEAELKLYM